MVKRHLLVIFSFFLFVFGFSPKTVWAGCKSAGGDATSCPAGGATYSCTVSGYMVTELESCNAGDATRQVVWTQCDTGAEAQAYCGGGSSLPWFGGVTYATTCAVTGGQLHTWGTIYINAQGGHNNNQIQISVRTNNNLTDIHYVTITNGSGNFDYYFTPNPAGLSSYLTQFYYYDDVLHAWVFADGSEKAVTCPVAPTCTVSAAAGQTSVPVGVTAGPYNISGTTGSPTTTMLYQGPFGTTAQYEQGSPNWWTNFCSDGTTCSASTSFSSPGNYWVMCNASNGTWCSGNPACETDPAWCQSLGFSFCGPNSYQKVCVYSAPVTPGLTSSPIPACGGPVTFTASESNFGVGCPSNNNRYYFLLTDNTNLALNTNSGWILSNIWKPTLVAGHSYPVSVQTNNGSASAAYTMPSFTVPGPTPPAQMTLVSPTDGAILTSPDVTLQAALPVDINWGQGCPTVPTYQFFVDTIQNNVRNLSGAFTYSGPNYYFAPAGLNYGTTYYWAVRACNGYSCGPLSAVWSFTIKNISPWWQTIEGDVYGLSVQSKIPSTCIPGNSCTPLIIRN